MRSTVAVAVGVAGLAIAWVLALALGDSPAAASEVVTLAAGASLALSLTGAGLMVRLRRRPLTVQIWVEVMTMMLGLAAGVLIASQQMFLSPADTKTVLVILVAAGTVGALTALAMAAKLNRAVEVVAGLAASLGQQPSKPATAQLPTRELSTLAAQLSEVGEQLHASARRERSLDASRRELVAWISHDLRTPLAGIRAMSEALEDGVVSDAETVGRYHRTIRAEVERLTGMVDDLFRLSRIHAGLINLQVEAASLSDLVSDAVSLAMPEAQAKGVRLTGQVPDGDVSVTLAIPEFLRVLRNLLDNALRHTPPAGQVSVHVGVSPTEAVVAVRDGCGGIPEGELSRVFELGYRGDSARSPGSNQRGGLGLAIAQGLVAAHGGHILVDNEAQGCCFTVHLPMVDRLAPEGLIQPDLRRSPVPRSVR